MASLAERIQWAITKPLNANGFATQKLAIAHSQQQERIWGNSVIGQTNNGQWTTKLGETLVFDVLTHLGENPHRPTPKNGFRPDWETDSNIYEVKTRNWWTSGTAGEKVLGTWIKYQEIPELYGKPLHIVCVGYQEHELTYGKTNYFGDNLTDKTIKILELAESWNIKYVPFSQLVADIDIN